MLELRPVCENCNAALAPENTEARICSFECTFCRTCVETVLASVCPNCGGGFVPRPIRPSRDWKGGFHTGAFPPTTEQKVRPVDASRHAELVARVAAIPPAER
jgi:uncharacterized protein